MIKMKKKLLAVVLSVVMIAALIVPMMAISAEGEPTLGIGLGTPTLGDRNDVDVIAVPVVLTANTGEMYAIRYQVVSTSGLDPYFDEDLYDEGYDEGDVTQKYGNKTAYFANTVNSDCVVDGNKGFQIVQDVVGGPTGRGITNTEGTLITVYFKAPTKVGSYNFEVIWMDGADNNKIQFVATTGAAVTYTVECKSHVAGEPEVTKAATCTAAGEKVTSCSVCGAEMNKETIPALGHEWDNGVVAENVKCGDTADTIFTCKSCGDTKTETGAKVDHDWKLDETASVAPKCEVAGKNVYVCQRANCPVGTKEETVTALKHNWELDEEAYVAPKCADAGKNVYVCSQANCPVGTKEEAIPALGHAFFGELEVVTAPTADAEGKYTIACVNDGCTEVEEYAAKKLATVVEHKDEDGNVILSFKAEEPILPEDVMTLPVGDTVENEDGTFSETLVFASVLVDDLNGEVEFGINTMGMVTNVVVTTTDADGNVVTVDSAVVDGMLVFNADLDGEYTLTYEEVKSSPVTSDASSTVAFVVIALIAVAGLVVVGKKRFAL